MRFSLQPRLGALIAVAVCAVLTPAAASSAHRDVRPSQTSKAADDFWVDPSGDSGSAPDITRISVGNTVDQVVFTIQTSNFPRLIQNGAAAWDIRIDADQNRATGFEADQSGNNGYDYDVSLFLGSAELFGCEASSCNGRALGNSAYTDGVWSVAVPLSLFQTKAFDFYVQTSSFGSHPANDWAGTPTYFTYKIGPPDPEVNIDLYPIANKDPKRKAATPHVPTGGSRETKQLCKGPARFDYNHNGCPGPYPRIEPVLPYADSTSNDTISFGAFTIRHLPISTRVTISIAGSSEVIYTGPSGTARSRLISGNTFPARTALTIRASHPGWIGYYAQAEITIRNPGLVVTKRLCVPATGGAPVSCSKVPRGR